MGAAMSDLFDVVGSGGGGKGGGGGGHTATEDANTLQSTATAEIIELLGEGEIVGLVDGGKSIFLNETPLIAANGTANFKGVEWVERHGLPDQEALPNYAAAAAEVGVSVKLTKSGGPVTRTITDADTNALRITVSVPALTSQDTSNGDMHGSKVEYTISVAPNGGAWVKVVDGKIEGKTTSGYQKAHRFDLPADGAPWQVRLERLTDDSDKVSLQNDLYWVSYTELIYGTFIYPDSALIGMRIDAKQFGSSIPARSYHVKGRKIRVPVNYNPETRCYSGTWDGEFKTAYSNNPAWIFLDLLLEPRFGLGDFIDESQCDIWGLYQIARYADAVDGNGTFVGVPDGKGGVMPRFTYNSVLQTKDEAYRVLQQIASCFRGMTFWSSGQVFARADMPRDAVKLVTPANVIGGTFTYASTGIKARHTVAHVSWNDPSDGFKPAIAVVEHREGLLRYGYRMIEVAAPGCTNREQAHRFGKWILESEQEETESVSYKVSWDHFDAMPGDIVNIADPTYAGVRMGGRLAAATAVSATLDAPVLFEVGKAYTLTVTLPDGTLAERALAVAPGTTAALTWSPALPEPPLVGAVWVLTVSDLKPRPFQIMGVKDNGDSTFDIAGLFHDPHKYQRVDEDLILDDDPYVIVDTGANGIPRPRNLRAAESTYWVNGLPHSRITVSWAAATSPLVSAYQAQVMAPGGVWAEYQPDNRTGFEIAPAIEGEYVIRVVAVSAKRQASPVAEVRILAHGKGEPPGKPSGLTATGGISQISLSWINPGDSDLAAIEVFSSVENDLATAVKIGESKSTTYVHAGLPALRKRWYWVRARDLAGNQGDFNSNLGTMAETRLVAVTDVGDAIKAEWFADLLLNVERIDFSFLDTRIKEVLDKTLLPDTMLEALRASHTRWEDIKVNRGWSEARFADVDTKVTELHAADQELAQQTVLIGAEFNGNLALVQDQITAVANANEATASRVTTLGAEFNGNLALVQDQITAVANANEATASRVTTLGAEVAGNAAAIYDESRTRATAVDAVASRVSVLDARVGANEATLYSESQARAAGDQASAYQTSILRSEFEGNKSAVGSFLFTLSSADSALSSRIDTLVSRISGAEAAISSEQSTRAGQDGALAQQITQARAYTDDRIAGYDSTIKTWVNNNSSGASRIETLESAVGSHNATLVTHASLLNGLSGHWSVAIDANGYVAGIDLLSRPVGGAPSSAIIMRADNFAVALPGYGLQIPFAIRAVNGSPKVAITETMIGDASIGTLTIAGNAVTVPMAGSWGGGTIGQGGFSLFAQMWMPASGGYRADLVTVNFQHGTDGGATGSAEYVITANNNWVSQAQGQAGHTIALSAMVGTTEGVTYAFWVRGIGGGNVQIKSIVMSILGCKR